nr:DNA adenine methylase [uncultured Capnocytophaga sp.]
MIEIERKHIAKPFLKWAGGKTQLIEEIKNNLPEIVFREPFTYIEPFVGSGAVLFWLLNHFPNMKKAVINDINKELIDTYDTIANSPKELISVLEDLQNKYYALENNEEAKKIFYYEKRTLFNTKNEEKLIQSALFIFLNRTCFNGLYRVNRKNEFNVPIGSYKRPLICDKENILAVSKVLQKVEIMCGDFEQTINYTENNTLFYFDPPYKPLSETSNFNAYAKDNFDDKEQIRLRDFCNKLNELNYYWILSNSDVKGKDKNNHFFDELYADFEIKRVLAKRSINANPEKRGVLNELLITNYKEVKKYDKAV